MTNAEFTNFVYEKGIIKMYNNEEEKGYSLKVKDLFEKDYIYYLVNQMFGENSKSIDKVEARREYADEVIRSIFHQFRKLFRNIYGNVKCANDTKFEKLVDGENYRIKNIQFAELLMNSNIEFKTKEGETCFECYVIDVFNRFNIIDKIDKEYDDNIKEELLEETLENFKRKLIDENKKVLYNYYENSFNQELIF